MEAWELEQTAAQYADTIFRVALQYTGQPCDAEDVLQEVLIERYQRQEPFTSSEYERRWLLRVTVNKCKNLLRTRGRRFALPLEELPEAAAPQDQPCRELYDAVLALPRNQRLTVDLYYYEGYSTEEIAAMLGCPAATVRTRLRRARKQLKSLLGGMEDEEEPLSNADGTNSPTCRAQ